LFARRGLIYAWGGGLLAGVVMFGSPDLTLRRAINRYHYMFSMEKLDIPGN